MKVAVAYHHLRLADGLHGVYRLLQRRYRNVRIDARQCHQQPVAQNHLSVVGALRVDTLGRNAWPCCELPAGFLKPANAQVFKFLFIHHGCTNFLICASHAAKNAHSASILLSPIL